MADNDNRDLMWIYQFEQPQQCCNRCIEGTHRYVIGALKKYPPARDKVLICIGLNPNDGIPGRLEDTVQAINDFAFDDKRKNKKIKDEKLPQWPLDGWIMLNLSPIRCGNSKSLSSKINKDKIYEIAHERNIEIIKSILEKYPDAVRLAAWGTKIDDISYLRDTLEKIIIKEKEEDIKWYCCDLPSDRKEALEKKQEELADLTQKNRDKAPEKTKKENIKEENIKEEFEKTKKEIEKEIEKYRSQLSKTKKQNKALEKKLEKLEDMKEEIENIEAGLTEKGNPRHPSRSWGMSPKKAVLHKFEISSYQTKLEKRFPQKSYKKSTINTKST